MPVARVASVARRFLQVLGCLGCKPRSFGYGQTSEQVVSWHGRSGVSVGLSAQRCDDMTRVRVQLVKQAEIPLTN
jgi:hypothetical protein